MSMPDNPFSGEKPAAKGGGCMKAVVILIASFFLMIGLITACGPETTEVEVPGPTVTATVTDTPSPTTVTNTATTTVTETAEPEPEETEPESGPEPGTASAANSENDAGTDTAQRAGVAAVPPPSTGARSRTGPCPGARSRTGADRTHHHRRRFLQERRDRSDRADDHRPEQNVHQEPGRKHPSLALKPHARGNGLRRVPLLPAGHTSRKVDHKESSRGRAAPGVPAAPVFWRVDVILCPST